MNPTHALERPPAWLQHPELQRVVACIHQAGGQARIVGGVVRDILRNVPSDAHQNSLPVDIDMACSLLPEHTQSVLQEAGYRVIPTGLAHGTVTVVLENSHIEITTLRRDIACDGRHAHVAFGTDFTEDAQRRDFTMNAVYLAIDGTLYDPHHGAADARAGRVRFIGDAGARIVEDGLRVLRFYRFTAQLGSVEIDASAQRACAEYCIMLASISGERVQQEMKKLLQSPAPYAALNAMYEAGIFAIVALPNMPPKPMAVLQQTSPNWLVRLSGLLPDIAAVAALAERWRLSKADSTMLHGLVQHNVPTNSTRLQHQHLVYAHGKLLHAGMCARGAALHNAPQLLQHAEALADWQVPVFPVKAADIQANGLAGKALGDCLKRLEKAWMDSGFRLSKDALIELA